MCDGIDNNCVGGVDEGVLTIWRLDADMDGYAAAGTTDLSRCDAPSPSHAPVAAVPGQGDCDDRREEVNPGAEEVCDGLDNDCASTYGEAVEEIRDPSVCDAQWTQIIQGSFIIFQTRSPQIGTNHCPHVALKVHT